jgi:hypothetical protein
MGNKKRITMEKFSNEIIHTGEAEKAVTKRHRNPKRTESAKKNLKKATKQLYKKRDNIIKNNPE